MWLAEIKHYISIFKQKWINIFLFRLRYTPSFFKICFHKPNELMFFKIESYLD